MNKVKYVWKPVGSTPLEVIEKLKEKYPKYKNEKISYAGRLDPMAEGILVLLIGDENKNREKYLNLKKEYESEIIFGISTDSNDGLGLITKIDLGEIDESKLTESIKGFVGKQNQKYPDYSSKAVNGKPLYWWARNNKLDEIQIPSKEIEIYSVGIISVDKISVEIMIATIINNIKKVHGDFRQEEIVSIWEEFLIDNEKSSLVKLKIKLNCSSGTYVRQIANQLGDDLGIGAFAYSIKRTSIGKITEKECIFFK